LQLNKWHGGEVEGKGFWQLIAIFDKVNRFLAAGSLFLGNIAKN
jgi:hypothetical protein